MDSGIFLLLSGILLTLIFVFFILPVLWRQLRRTDMYEEYVRLMEEQPSKDGKPKKTTVKGLTEVISRLEQEVDRLQFLLLTSTITEAYVLDGHRPAIMLDPKFEEYFEVSVAGQEAEGQVVLKVRYVPSPEIDEWVLSLEPVYNAYVPAKGKFVEGDEVPPAGTQRYKDGQKSTVTVHRGNTQRQRVEPPPAYRRNMNAGISRGSRNPYEDEDIMADPNLQAIPYPSAVRRQPVYGGNGGRNTQTMQRHGAVYSPPDRGGPLNRSYKPQELANYGVSNNRWSKMARKDQDMLLEYYEQGDFAAIRALVRDLFES